MDYQPVLAAFFKNCGPRSEYMDGLATRNTRCLCFLPYHSRFSFYALGLLEYFACRAFRKYDVAAKVVARVFAARPFHIT